MRVPDGWNTLPISDILERVSEPVFPKPEENYYQIGIRSHGKGLFHKEAVTGEALGDKRVFRVHPDCFIVNIVFAWEQAVAKTSSNEIGMIASHRFPMFRPKNNQCDIHYLTYFFKTPKGKYLLELASPGGAGRNKTLGQNEFSLLKLTLPPINEQQKITQILSTWDKAIDKLEALIAAKQKRKKALMQQLLTGNKRYFGFNEAWVQFKLGEIFSKISNGLTYDTNAEEGLPVTRIETTTNGKINYEKVGWAPNNDNTKRFTLCYGDILYSHINSLEHIGRVAFYRAEKPLYHGMNLLLLRPNEKVVPELIFHILNSMIGKKYARNYAKSAVNQASISTADIKSFKIKIPTLKEQLKIADVITAADNEITIHQNQLAALKQQKKALMQQLLTGKKRVNIDLKVVA